MKDKTIVYQAKSFYNAYIALEQIYNNTNETMFLVPVIVNGCFSIEITLKAILKNNDIKYKNEHNLVVLYNKLPTEIQKMINDWVLEKTPEYKDDSRINEELLIISGAYNQWRYCFDNEPASIDTCFVSSFANAVIGVMFSLGLNVDLTEEIVTNNEIDMVSHKIEENRKQFIEKNKEYIKKKEQ